MKPIAVDMEKGFSASGVTLARGIELLLASKRAANFRPRYVDSLRLYLSQFARGREDVPLSDFTVEAIERWFSLRGEALSTQASNVGRLSALFSFAERRGWIGSNPVRRMERVRLDPKTPRILTVEQSALLMEWAMYQRPGSLAFFALALFGGLRPEELERIGWADVDLASGIVTVDAAASKTRRRRLVHLRPNGCEWVAFAMEIGASLPLSRSSRRRAVRLAARRMGFEGGWPQDVLRHSAASYWLAATRDVCLVADELGNSPSILLRHYRELVQAEKAVAFWEIRP